MIPQKHQGDYSMDLLAFHDGEKMLREEEWRSFILEEISRYNWHELWRFILSGAVYDTSATIFFQLVLGCDGIVLSYCHLQGVL